MVTANSVNLTAQGTVYYNGAGAFSGLDAGASGQVLTSNGTGVAPSFQAAGSGGGSYIFISSQTPSGASAATFTTGIDNTYDTYYFLWKNVSSSSDNVSFIAEVSTDGGSTWKATGYSANYLRYNSGGTGAQNITTAILVSESGNFDTGSVSGGQLMFHYVRSGGTCLVEGTGTYGGNAGGSVGAACPATLTINGIRFRMSSGNISGFFAMYGVVES